MNFTQFSSEKKNDYRFIFFFIRDEYFSTQDTFATTYARSLVARAQLLLRVTKMMKDKVLVYRLLVVWLLPS